MNISLAVQVALGLSVSNFFWQWFTKKRNWGKAAERSYYQAIALTVFMIIASF